MDAKIDWVSFTLPTETDVFSPEDLYQIASFKLMTMEREWHEYAFDGQNFEHVIGRAPYRFALVRDDRGLRIFGGGHTATILYEFSGKGCNGLCDYATAARLLSVIDDRISRLDYAVDVRCGTLPSIFTSKREANYFRSISTIVSDTGETVYLGSPKSDRFARVYRYNPPHPRHKLLRCEFVFRRALAKGACRSYADAGDWQAFTSACGNTWGLKHPNWQPEIVTDEKLKTESRSKASDQTVNWLYKQVAPAMARLIKEEAISIADFLEHVYNI